MRLLCLLLPLLACLGCATNARLVRTDDAAAVSLAEVADVLAQADVVALGELHQTPAVHRTHHELLRELHARQPNLVVAMEMFERDVQTDLLHYLAGTSDEGAFLAAARPWPDYARDYRPVIEFCKQNGLVVLAANAPRPLAGKVAKQGIAAVQGERDVARTTTAPEDDYWQAFVAEMGDHGGMVGEDAMKRFYAAQCLKDDTMAESIVDHLAAREQAGDRPLVVLICGRFHSDYRRGTVARIQSRRPDLQIQVVSAEAVDDLAAGLYTAPRGVADFVVVVQKQAAKAPPLPPARTAKVHSAKPAPAPAAPTTAPAPAAPPAAAPAETAERNPEGQRPALGLMPDYASEGGGVRVESVRSGGPAEQAGIEAGDVVVAIAGKPVADVQAYTELLDTLRIGTSVAVRVRRGAAEVDLQVKVGARSR